MDSPVLDSVKMKWTMTVLAGEVGLLGKDNLD